jgi:hypothetical protein
MKVPEDKSCMVATSSEVKPRPPARRSEQQTFVAWVLEFLEEYDDRSALTVNRR